MAASLELCHYPNTQPVLNPPHPPPHPAGGGKGTIAKKMIKDFSFLHLSTGDVLRKHVREGTAVGKTAQSFMVKGAWPTAWYGRVGLGRSVSSIRESLVHAYIYK